MSPSPMTIETFGIEQIPDDRRDASPLDLFRLTFGGANTFATSVLGSFPILFGLSFQAVFLAIVIGIAAIVFIFIGRFAFNLVQSVSTFAVLIVTCTSPWRVIMIIGLIVRRGFYHADDLQVFTRGQRGGRYWFHHGWNWRGIGAWIPSAVAGLYLVNIPGQFVGPFGDVASGIDVSLPVTLGLASLLYLALLRAFPEPSAVHGPDDLRPPTGVNGE